jgi:hypothetical protein
LPTLHHGGYNEDSVANRLKIAKVIFSGRRKIYQIGEFSLMIYRFYDEFRDSRDGRKRYGTAIYGINTTR